MNFLIFLTVIVALTVSVARASKILNDLWSFQLMTRSVPSIEVDYCYSKVDESDAVSTVLVAIDCQNKMLSSMPLPSKGFNLRGQAEHLVRFSVALNHRDKVEFVSDAEPTVKVIAEPTVKVIAGKRSTSTTAVGLPNSCDPLSTW